MSGKKIIYMFLGKDIEAPEKNKKTEILFKRILVDTKRGQAIARWQPYKVWSLMELTSFYASLVGHSMAPTINEVWFLGKSSCEPVFLDFEEKEPIKKEGKPRLVYLPCISTFTGIFSESFKKSIERIKKGNY